MRFVTVWKTSEADNEKRRQMAAAAQKAAAQKQVAEAAELAKKNAANARQNMQTQVSKIFACSNGFPFSQFLGFDILSGIKLACIDDLSINWHL